MWPMRARVRVAQVKDSLGRVSGPERGSADVYSKCQGCNRASVRGRTRARARPVPETMAAGGAEELLFCHAWLRFTRAPREKPACLNVFASLRVRAKMNFTVNWITSTKKDSFFFFFAKIVATSKVERLNDHDLWLLVFASVEGCNTRLMLYNL